MGKVVKPLLVVSSVYDFEESKHFEIKSMYQDDLG